MFQIQEQVTLRYHVYTILEPIARCTTMSLLIRLFQTHVHIASEIFDFFDSEEVVRTLLTCSITASLRDEIPGAWSWIARDFGFTFTDGLDLLATAKVFDRWCQPCSYKLPAVYCRSLTISRLQAASNGSRSTAYNALMNSLIKAIMDNTVSFGDACRTYFVREDFLKLDEAHVSSDSEAAEPSSSLPDNPDGAVHGKSDDDGSNIADTCGSSPSSSAQRLAEDEQALPAGVLLNLRHGVLETHYMMSARWGPMMVGLEVTLKAESNTCSYSGFERGFLWKSSSCDADVVDDAITSGRTPLLSWDAVHGDASSGGGDSDDEMLFECTLANETPEVLLAVNYLLCSPFVGTPGVHPYLGGNCMSKFLLKRCRDSMHADQNPETDVRVNNYSDYLQTTAMQAKKLDAADMSNDDDDLALLMRL